MQLRSVKCFFLGGLLTTMVVAAPAALSNSTEDSHRQMVFGASWEPLGFNPIRALDSGSYAAQTLVYEGLVKYDSHMEIVPAIARRFSVASDGLTYSFSLRDQARFSTAPKLQSMMSWLLLHWRSPSYPLTRLTSPA